MTALRTALCCAALVVVSRRAAAEDGLAIGISPTPVGDRAWLVQSPDARGHKLVRLSAISEYAHEPLVVVTPGQQLDRIVASQVWTHTAASLALLHCWLFALDVPLLLNQTSQRRADGGVAPPPPSNGPALGDVRLTGRVRVLGPAGPGWQLGLGAEVWTPTGSTAAYAGDGAPRARGFVSAGATADRWYVTLDVGLLGRKSRQLDGALPLRVGSSLTTGIAVGYALDPGRTVTLGPEATLQLPVSGGARLFDPRSTIGQALLGVRWRIRSGPLEVGAAGGPGIGQGAGSADYRVLASVAFTPEQRPPPPDQDVDGVPDETDICPNVPGVPSNDPMMNGCPEIPPDSDGDSIPDQFDACPKVAGEPTGSRRTHGCPHVVVPAPRAALVQENIVISDQIQFETGTANLRPESNSILEQVARVLREHREIDSVEVQGHTDDTGTEELNRRLSDDRARAVVDWLRAHGIAAERLTAKGYGRDRPLSDNATEEGRAKNRRVEFRILQRSEKPREP